MSYLQTIILSIIEGLTEFLPISSTGHLILAQKLLGVQTTEFTKSFDIIIQLSAILAIVILYWPKIIRAKKLWWQVSLAFIPTGIIGLTLYRLIKGFFLDNLLITVSALFFGGLILLLIDRLPALKKNSGSISDLGPSQLLSLGLFQSLSIVPGVSRSAASIVGGLVGGLSRSEAVEFSFLLAVPTMATATGYDLLKTGLSFSAHEITLLLLGSVFSFLSAFLAVKTFISFVSKHNFTLFALYRIFLAVIIWFFFQV